MKTILATLLYLSLPLAVANAGAYFNLANNCPEPVTFKLGEFTSLVAPYNYTLSPYITTETAANSTISYTSATTTAALNFSITNGWSKNYITFATPQGKIGTSLLPGSNEYDWHGIPDPLNVLFVGTPTLTITACPSSIDSSASVALQGIKRVLVFGDSLSDKGTLSLATGGIIPKSTPYYSGMFSNGPTWAANLANQLLSQQIKLSNYAVGGATSVFNVKNTMPYSMGNEFTVYQENAQTFAEASQQRLAIILIGGNDYLDQNNLSAAQIDQLTNSVVIAGIQKITTELLASGIHKFIFINLPDLSNTPYCRAANNCDTVRALITQHNQKLKSLVANYHGAYPAPDYFLQLIDITGVFNLALNNTQQFNAQYHTYLSNTYDSCWNGGYTLPSVPALNSTVPGASNSPDLKEALAAASESAALPCSDPEHYIFWDRLHPTQQMHQALLQFIESAIGISAAN